MKTLILIFFIFISFSYSQLRIEKGLYEISWNANDIGENIQYWEVYLEIQSSPYGFDIYEGCNYSYRLEKFKVGVVQNIGQLGKVIYLINLKENNKWAKVGIIANNGTRSKIGASNKIKLKKKNKSNT